MEEMSYEETLQEVIDMVRRMDAWTLRQTHKLMAEREARKRANEQQMAALIGVVSQAFSEEKAQ